MNLEEKFQIGQVLDKRNFCVPLVMELLHLELVSKEQLQAISDAEKLAI